MLVGSLMKILIQPLRLHGRLGRNSRVGWMARCVLLGLLILAGVTALDHPFLASAQENPFEKALGDTEVPEVLATWEMKVEPESARPGENLRVIISGKIAEGWYTYSLLPQGEFAPPPTRLKMIAGDLQVMGPWYETNPVIKKDKVFNIPLAFHPKAVRFYQNLRVPQDQAPGDIEISRLLQYQVCNNSFCTPPQKELLTARLSVESGPVRPAFAYMERTIDYVDDQGNFRIDADTLESVLAGGLGAFLLLAAGFGLLSLLTPCVFPMIPITVSFFTGASHEGKRNVLGLALLFGGGIIISYTGLGLLLTFFLGATGVSQFATNPWVNLAVALFFALFALSLMGVFNLSLPGGMVNRLNRMSGDAKGPIGVIIMGVAFTATSFTCTAPFLGTLLVAASQGQIFWPAIGMLVFSTLFALPFFLLALFPRYVLALRGKSGNWMVQLKVVLGLVELIAAFKFLSNADLIWQWGLFNRTALLGFSAVLLVIGALVVLGLAPWPGISVARRGLARAATGSLILVTGLYLASGLFGKELDSYTESYLPPDLENGLLARFSTSDLDSTAPDGNNSSDGNRTNWAAHDLPWLTSLDEGLKQASATGKPVFIDFTGYTCINCRWMEKKIFSAKPVYETFLDKFVLVQLYTDGGDNAQANQNLQVDRFRTLALPYYVILSPDNAVLAKHGGIMPTPREFLVFLNQGLKLNKPQVVADTKQEN